MVTKSKKTGSAKGKVKVGKLNLEKETVKDFDQQQKETDQGWPRSKVCVL